MILKGKVVKLRPIRISDAKRFVQWFADEEVTRYLTRRPITLKEEKKWIRNMPKHWKTDQVFALDTKAGQHIGSIGLSKISRQDKNAEYGIVIGAKTCWGQGCGTDASRLILDYGFKVLKLHRIYLRVYAYNKRAIEVYRRLGFKVEGRLKEHVLYRKKYYDVYFMGLLKNEWQKAKRTLK